MRNKYLRTRIGIVNGQVRSQREYFCKNSSLFDVTGRKIGWGDIAPRDVKDCLPDFEPVVFDPRYVKKNSIARVVDGEIQTSELLIKAYYL